MGILENRQKLIGNPLRISGLKEFQEEEVASFFKKKNLEKCGLVLQKKKSTR